MQYLDAISDKRRQRSESIQAEYTAAKLAAVLKEHLKSYKPGDKRLLESLKAIEAACSRDDESLDILREIRDLLNKEHPQVVVPAPTVKVEKTTVDTSRLEKLLEEVVSKLSTPAKKEKAAIVQEPLIYYTAQNLDNAPDGSQYIGFMSISGNWYIMHHDTEKDTNRYYFGDGSYEEEWGRRYSLEYRPLSEVR